MLVPNKDQLIWSTDFNIATDLYTDLKSSSKLVNLFLTSGPVFELDFDSSIDRAAKIFDIIFPGEDFLPRAPDPEEIIIGGGDEEGSNPTDSIYDPAANTQDSTSDPAANTQDSTSDPATNTRDSTSADPHNYTSGEVVNPQNSASNEASNPQDSSEKAASPQSSTNNDLTNDSTSNETAQEDSLTVEESQKDKASPDTVES